MTHLWCFSQISCCFTPDFLTCIFIFSWLLFLGFQVNLWTLSLWRLLQVISPSLYHQIQQKCNFCTLICFFSCTEYKLPLAALLHWNLAFSVMTDLLNFYSKDPFSSLLLYDLLENFGTVALCFLLKTSALRFRMLFRFISHLTGCFLLSLSHAHSSNVDVLQAQPSPACLSHNSPCSCFMIPPPPSPTKSLLKWHRNLHFQPTEFL